MPFADTMKRIAPAIVIALAGIIVGWGYEHFLGPNAQMVKVLEDQVSKKEDCLKYLKNKMARIDEEELKAIQKFDDLKVLLSKLNLSFATRQEIIHEIEKKITQQSIQENMDVLDQYKSDILARRTSKGADPCAGM